MDVNQTNCGDCWALYTNIESLGCTPKTNMIYLNKNILPGDCNSRQRKENLFEITEEKLSIHNEEERHAWNRNERIQSDTEF